jgi:hypothetical protein
VTLPPSLTVAFDASVLYAADNATPVSGAIGFVIREGREPVVERSRAVDAFVGNVALEYRALRAASRVVADRFDRVASVHIRGDADVVIQTVDPDHPATPSGAVVRRRGPEQPGTPPRPYRPPGVRATTHGEGRERSGQRLSVAAGAPRP